MSAGADLVRRITATHIEIVSEFFFLTDSLNWFFYFPGIINIGLSAPRVEQARLFPGQSLQFFCYRIAARKSNLDTAPIQ